MSAPISYSLQPMIEAERKAREDWRKRHATQVFVVELALPMVRFALIFAIAVPLSPLLLFGWLCRWLITGETWPLRSSL